MSGVDMSGLELSVDAACAEMDRLREINRELLEALEVAHDHIVGLKAYLATCGTAIIIDNLETTIAALREQSEQSKAAILKARGEAK